MDVHLGPGILLPCGINSNEEADVKDQKLNSFHDDWSYKKISTKSLTQVTVTDHSRKKNTNQQQSPQNYKCIWRWKREKQKPKTPELQHVAIKTKKHDYQSQIHVKCSTNYELNVCWVGWEAMLLTPIETHAFICELLRYT